TAYLRQLGALRFAKGDNVWWTLIDQLNHAANHRDSASAVSLDTEAGLRSHCGDRQRARTVTGRSGSLASEAMTPDRSRRVIRGTTGRVRREVLLWLLALFLNTRC